MQCYMEHIKTMSDSNIMEDVGITATNPVTTAEEYKVHKTTRIGAEAVVVETTVRLHITVGHTECVPIRKNTAVPQHMATERKQYGVTRCQVVRETSPDRSG